MMGRLPRCDENGVKKGAWTAEEDRKLVDYIEKHGYGSWSSLPKLAGLNRCGKSCRLRWTNYLRPDIKRGKFSEEEEQTIINLHAVLGNKWSAMASHLPGRTDNEIKNFWNTHLKKKLLQIGIDPVTHRPRTDLPLQLLAAANFSNLNAPTLLQSDAVQHLAKIQLLHNLINLLSGPTFPVNHQLYELLGINSQLPFGFALQSNILNSEASQNQPQLSEYHDHQPMKDPKFCSNDNDQFASSCFSFPAIYPTSTPPPQLPALVPASPENQPTTVYQTENKICPNHIFNPSSSTSTTLEAWADLMGDEASESYWKDIIDQESLQSWPIC